MKHQLKQRMAALQVEVDETTAQRHLATVAAELRNPRPARALGRRRIKRATLVAASLLVLLPGAALAAESAVPGDLLYPVKLGVERAVSLVDPNIEAEHRIEEVEILIDRDTPLEEVADRLGDADQAVRDRDVPEDLLNRLDMVRDRVRVGPGTDNPGPDNPGPDNPGPDNPGPDNPGPDNPGTNNPTDDVPGDTTRQRDGSGPNETPPVNPSTTTAPPETDRPGQRGSTTTTAPQQDDRPGRDATTTTEPRRDRGDRAGDG